MYIIGPVASDGTPRTEGDEIIGPGMVLPARDLVVDEFVQDGYVYDAIGSFVVPGPNGVIGQNVRVRPEPVGGIIGAPLAYEIKIAGKWYKLNNESYIEVGVTLGILDLIPWLWGGVYNTFWDFDLSCNQYGCS